jgi:hypothetical protein
MGITGRQSPDPTAGVPAAGLQPVGGCTTQTSRKPKAAGWGPRRAGGYGVSAGGMPAAQSLRTPSKRALLKSAEPKFTCDRSALPKST